MMEAKMATNQTTAAKDAVATKTDDEVTGERKAQEAAAKEAVANGAAATDEARKRDAETLKAQEQSRPYPSQEEADAIKSTAAVGAAPYATRAMKA